MKRINLPLLAVMLLLSYTFSSCKKDSSINNPGADYSAELTTHSDDQARFSEESDEIDNDANLSIDNFPAFDGFIGGISSLPCNATAIHDTLNGQKRIVITYNGPNCQGNVVRNGTVILSMPLGQRWRDSGAVLTINVNNLHILRLRDTSSITINGVKTITNVNGGVMMMLASGRNIVHDINSSGMSITFDNGTTRSWQIAKRRVYSYNGGVVITTTGRHSDGTNNNISEWGVNRFGNPFVTSITQPLVVRQDCMFRLVSGEVTHQRLAASVVVSFGLDAQGNPATCPPMGTPFYMKIVFTDTNGNVRTVIRPY